MAWEDSVNDGWMVEAVDGMEMRGVWWCLEENVQEAPWGKARQKLVIQVVVADRLVENKLEEELVSLDEVH